MNNRGLHCYDPLYEVVFLGDVPGGRSPRRSFERQKIKEIQKSIIPFLHCPEVGRLNWLSQAGFLHLVFASAGHSRFSHALGTIHLGCIALEAVTVTDRLRTNSTRNTFVTTESLREFLNEKHWTEEFLIALFLHDLGHYPFSHVLEKNIGLKQILGNQFVSHEEAVCQLIKGENDGAVFGAYLEKFANDKGRLICNVFTEQDGFEREI